jgi:hypothetical protein
LNLRLAPALIIALAALSCLPPTAVTPSPLASTATPTPPATATSTPTATPTPTPSPSPSPTPSPAPTAYTSPRGVFTVDQPRAFAVVASPLTVSGSAVLFEGAFRWRLIDLAGKELAKGTGQASPGAPARGTFSFSVTFSVTSETYAYISLISTSARDGSVDDEARVPIVLAAR